ncbi:hypothetical protein WR164_04970 [Philodulcilactobacillus myokoensis]|uniref:Uncharacterized protein n=1 Tax=Philodulcilactobacillus myokoensis TaxID=2929573 RepID=A0A9W6B0S6_9LACO|nr:hypothetical protein [Philodulcilactobacillus myokoensis]GLB46518.1 hypothetical protein WR164_04970 [Philodulcilactobacillus myokoensis]
MTNSKLLACLFFIFYLILFFMVIASKNMIAMYMMSIGMLLEALVNLIRVYHRK